MCSRHVFKFCFIISPWVHQLNRVSTTIDSLFSVCFCPSFSRGYLRCIIQRLSARCSFSSDNQSSLPNILVANWYLFHYQCLEILPIEISFRIGFSGRSGVDSRLSLQRMYGWHSWHTNGILRGFKATVESVDAFSNKDFFLRKFSQMLLSQSIPLQTDKSPLLLTLEYHSAQSLLHHHHYRHHHWLWTMVSISSFFLVDLWIIFENISLFLDIWNTYRVFDKEEAKYDAGKVGGRGILDNSKSPDTFALSLGSVGEILLPIMCLQRNRVRSPLCFFNTWWGGGLAYEYRACSIIRIYFRWIFSKPSIRLQVEWNWFNLEETKREDESDKSLETIWVHQLLSTFNIWETVNS